MTAHELTQPSKDLTNKYAGNLGEPVAVPARYTAAQRRKSLTLACS
jgi:hypothetical protein